MHALMKLKNKVLISIFFFAAHSAWSTPTKVGFMGSFRGGSANEVLSDGNLEKGARVFFRVFPEAKDRIELVMLDNHGDPTQGPVLLDRAQSQGIRIILGISKSRQALVINRLIEDRKMLLITSLATHSQVTAGLQRVFRMMFVDEAQSRESARFAARKLRTKKVLILRNVDEITSVEGSATFSDALPKTVQRETWDYTKERMDAASLRSRLKKFQPDLVFIPDMVSMAVTGMGIVFAHDPKIRLLGNNGWGSREVLRKAMPDFPGIEAYYAYHWHESLPAPLNARFLKGFDETFPSELPTPGAAAMFDTLYVFDQAMKSARSTQPDQIIAALKSEKFQTTTGEIRFNHPNDNSPNRKVIFLRPLIDRHEIVAFD
jgi:branched-chain amino acid transport system substrate-binding protein